MASTRKTLTLYDDYHAMMADPVRLLAYRAAIESVVKAGDVVIDLGAGLGILSFLALRAGASRVYAIEKGDSITLARQVAERNGFSSRMEFIPHNSKDVTLPERADVLVSETLGSFAVEENTLDFTIDARNRLLKPNARMIPQGLRLFLAPVQASHEAKKSDFWRDVIGFDYTPARDECVSRMSLARFNTRSLLATPQIYSDINLATAHSASLDQRLLFKIHKKGTIHGLAGWFQARLTEEIIIDTSPSKPSTHWQQAFFPFRESIKVMRDDFLEVVMHVNPESSHSDNSSIQYTYRCSQRHGNSGGQGS